MPISFAYPPDPNDPDYEIWRTQHEAFLARLGQGFAPPPLPIHEPPGFWKQLPWRAGETLARTGSALFGVPEYALKAGQWGARQLGLEPPPAIQDVATRYQHLREEAERGANWWARSAVAGDAMPFEDVAPPEPPAPEASTIANLAGNVLGTAWLPMPGSKAFAAGTPLVQRLLPAALRTGLPAAGYTAVEALGRLPDVPTAEDYWDVAGRTLGAAGMGTAFGVGLSYLARPPGLPPAPSTPGGGPPGQQPLPLALPPRPAGPPPGQDLLPSQQPAQDVLGLPPRAAGYDPRQLPLYPETSPSAMTRTPVEPVIGHPLVPAPAPAVAQAVSQEAVTAMNASAANAEATGTVLDSLRKGLDTLSKDERGALHLGPNPNVEFFKRMSRHPILQSIATVRRYAEKDPEMAQYYALIRQQHALANRIKFELLVQLEPRFRMSKDAGEAMDLYLRTRRREGLAAPVPAGIPYFHTIVEKIDDAFDWARNLANTALTAKGLAPINKDDFYVPFTRYGNYVVSAHHATLPPRVSFVDTLRDAEKLHDAWSAQPGWQVTAGPVNTILPTGTKVPGGFKKHFLEAQLIEGESTDLTDPMRRYATELSNYIAGLRYNDDIQALIGTMANPDSKYAATTHFAYLRTNPSEHEALRSFTARYALMGALDSTLFNFTGVPLLGVPKLMEDTGMAYPVALKAYGTTMKQLATNTLPQELRHALYLAERDGHIRPINTEELFAVSEFRRQFELGAPAIHRSLESGSLAQMGGVGQAIGKAARAVVDPASTGLEHLFEAAGNIDLTIGRGLSYAANTARNQLIKVFGGEATDALLASRHAYGASMQGFAAMETFIRKASVAVRYQAARDAGVLPGDALKLATDFSNNVNWDYSKMARAPIFRGHGAPFGVFSTFATEALGRMMHYMHNIASKPGPASAFLSTYLAMTGLRGVPGMQAADQYAHQLGGPDPGWLSRGLPESVWYGPSNVLTGYDISSKATVHPPLTGMLDPETMALHPEQNPLFSWPYRLGSGVSGLINDPFTGANIQRQVERMLPRAFSNVVASARWGKAGPAGQEEQGKVGTFAGHTPGSISPEDPTRRFFTPTTPQRIMKGFGFTPHELLTMRERGHNEREELRLATQRLRPMIKAAAAAIQQRGFFDSNDPTIQALRKAGHTTAIRTLAQATATWKRDPTHGSVLMHYAQQTEQPMVTRLKHKRAREAKVRE